MIGVLTGLVLLVFAGILFAGSPLGEEAATSLRGRRLTGGDVLVSTTLAAEAAVGATAISVTSGTGIITGHLIRIGAAGAADAEEVRVEAVSAGGSVAGAGGITLKTALTKAHALGAAVAVLEESLHQQSLHQLSSGSSGSLRSSDSSGSGKLSNSFESSSSGSAKGNLFKSWTEGQGAATGGGWFTQLLIMICYGCVYKGKVVDPMGVLPPQQRSYDNADDFNFGICDCFKDCHICMMVTCCPLIRVAHTNAVAGVCGFWETIFCMWCSFLLFGMGPCCLNVYFRIHLKDHMGIEDHCVNDMILAWCCLPCITGQQALAVDQVMGFSFKCPCSVERVGGGGFE